METSGAANAGRVFLLSDGERFWLSVPDSFECHTPHLMHFHQDASLLLRGDLNRPDRTPYCGDREYHNLAVWEPDPPDHVGPRYGRTTYLRVPPERAHRYLRYVPDALALAPEPVVGAGVRLREPVPIDAYIAAKVGCREVGAGTLGVVIGEGADGWIHARFPVGDGPARHTVDALIPRPMLDRAEAGEADADLRPRRPG